jgi:hypothetical protein
VGWSDQHFDRSKSVPLEGKWAHIAARLSGEAYVPDETVEEPFITEHYWGYAAQRDGSTLEYRVEHGARSSLILV